MNNNCGISNKAGISKFRLLSVALEYRILKIEILTNIDKRRVERRRSEVCAVSTKADGLSQWLLCWVGPRS